MDKLINRSLHLSDITIKATTIPHHELSNETRLFAQVIAEPGLLGETGVVSKDEEDSDWLTWKLKNSLNIPVICSKFSVVIVCKNGEGSNKVLGVKTFLVTEAFEQLLDSQEKGPIGFNLSLDKYPESPPPDANLVFSMSLPVDPNETAPTDESVREEVHSQVKLSTPSDIKLLQIYHETRAYHYMPSRNWEFTAINATFQKMLSLCDSKEKPFLLDMVGDLFLGCYTASNNLDALNQAVLAYETAVKLSSIDDSNRRQYLFDLGSCLVDRYGALMNDDDADDAFSSLQLSAHPQVVDGTDPFARLHKLGATLKRKYDQTNDIQHIDKCIRALETSLLVLSTSSDIRPEKYILLDSLVTAYAARFDRLGEVSDINKSITYGEEGLSLLSENHPGRPAALINLGISYFYRFTLLENLPDVDSAISCQQTAFNLTNNDHYKANCLNNIGYALMQRYARTGNPADNDNCMIALEECVKLTAEDDPFYVSRLENLGNAFLTRFESNSNVEDLQKALSSYKAAQQHAPEGHPRTAGILTGLGNAMVQRFTRLRDLDDIDQSISYLKDAAKCTPEDHPMIPGRFNNLGIALISRYRNFDEQSDYENAMTAFENAVQHCPDSHPMKPVYLVNVGTAFLAHFDKLGILSDLDKAISVLEDAVQRTPPDHGKISSRVGNLGIAFWERFEATHNHDDLEKAISLFDDAMKNMPSGSIDESTLMNLKGNALLERFNALQIAEDIENSISILEEVVKNTPDDHPALCGNLNSLAQAYETRFRSQHQSNSFQQALACYARSAQSSSGIAPARFAAAVEWARLALDKESTRSSALKPFSIALELLPQLAWLGLSVEGRHKQLMNRQSIVSDAVGTAVEVGEYALAIEWLEQGHSIVWGQMLQLRTPVDDLYEVKPELATRLKQLSQALQESSSKMSQLSLEEEQKTGEDVSRTHRKLTVEWQNLVHLIRTTVPGFERFLLPKTLSELSRAALRGPVVAININKNRADALAMMPNGKVIHIALPGFKEQHAMKLLDIMNNIVLSSGRSVTRELVEVERAGRLMKKKKDANLEFQNILAQLWVYVVKPILDGLGFKVSGDERPSHIWWCPGGALALLPIHAAGLYQTSAAVRSKLSDHAISSYTPTFSALLDLPEHRSTLFRLLAIAQPSAPGLVALPGTKEELQRIKECIVERKFPWSSLMDSQATLENVVNAMQQSNWVHFACHGVQDRMNPTDSGLILAGGKRLKLSEIIKMSLPQAQLAFLSACQTATGVKELSGESVHLAAGMLFAGYHSVIATMWSITDNDAPRIANDVYRQLLANDQPDYRNAAEALHHAVQNLQAQGASFLSWVPFIHIGA